MSKLLLTLTNPPSGVGASQLFYSEAHFNEWFNPLKDSTFPSASVDLTAGTFEFEGGSGIIEVKSDEFKNY